MRKIVFVALALALFSVVAIFGVFTNESALKKMRVNHDTWGLECRKVTRIPT